MCIPSVFQGEVLPVTGNADFFGKGAPDSCWFCAKSDCLDRHHRCPSCGNWRIKWYKVEMDDGRGWLSRCLNCDHWFPDPKPNQGIDLGQIMISPNPRIAPSD